MLGNRGSSETRSRLRVMPSLLPHDLCHGRVPHAGSQQGILLGNRGDLPSRGSFSNWYVVSIDTGHIAQSPQSGPRWSPAFKIEPVLFPPSFLQTAPTMVALVYKFNCIHTHPVIYPHFFTHTHIYYLITVETFLKLWNKDVNPCLHKSNENTGKIVKNKFFRTLEINQRCATIKKYLFKEAC